MNNSDYQQNAGYRQQNTKRCPCCGEELPYSEYEFLFCCHCGSLLSDGEDGQAVDNSEWWSELWPNLAYLGGFLCYAFAVLDIFLTNIVGIDITGVWWTPPLFSLFGYLLQTLAKASPKFQD